MRNRHLRAAMLAVAVALGASSCSNYSTGNYAPVAVAGVRVTPQSVQIAAVGGTAQLQAVVAPLDATDRALTWESSDETVATVDAAGRVTGRAVGSTVFITAITHDGHFQSSSNVSVGQ